LKTDEERLSELEEHLTNINAYTNHLETQTLTEKVWGGSPVVTAVPLLQGPWHVTSAVVGPVTAVSIRKLKNRQREKNSKKKWNRISKNCGTTTKGKHIQDGNMFRRKKKGTEAIFDAVLTENFPKLMSDTTKPWIQKA